MEDTSFELQNKKKLDFKHSNAHSQRDATIETPTFLEQIMAEVIYTAAAVHSLYHLLWLIILSLT